jgi:hypothetical protein
MLVNELEIFPDYSKLGLDLFKITLEGVELGLGTGL